MICVFYNVTRLFVLLKIYEGHHHISASLAFKTPDEVREQTASQNSFWFLEDGHSPAVGQALLLSWMASTL